jgi:hypothetical protein
MRKLILIALSCLPVISFAGQDFDRGYALGYKEGYQKIAGQFSIAPISPIPPIPGIDQDTFFGGYNQGFIDGMAEAGVTLKDEDGEDVDPD